MKRGFLLNPRPPTAAPSPAKRKKAAAQSQKKASSVSAAPAQTPSPSTTQTAYPAAEVVGRLLEIETLRERIAHSQRELQQLTERRDGYREALNYAEHRPSHSPVWMCGGDLFFQLPAKKATKIIGQDKGHLGSVIDNLERTIEADSKRLQELTLHGV